MRRKDAMKKVRIVVPPETADINAGKTKHAPSGRKKPAKLGTSKSPAGKGLGKAGAKRLGRLLKRAIQSQGEAAVMGDASAPKTPVRLFKHQIRNNRTNGTKINTPKKASPQISMLILSLVSQCRHNGGMTMAELKQTLANEGYDVIKNNKHVTVVTKRLLNNENLLQTKTNSVRLNKQPEILLQKRAVQTRNKPKATATQTTVPYQKSKAVKGKVMGYATKEEKTPTEAPKMLKTARPNVKKQTRTQKVRIVKGRQKQNATKKCKMLSKTTMRKKQSTKITTHNERLQKKQTKHRKTTSRTYRQQKSTRKG